jgi:hypothetical protein
MFLALTDHNEYKGEPRFIVKVPGPAVLMSTDAITGRITAPVYVIGNLPTSLFGWTRFNTTFNRYRILKCVMTYTSLFISNTGYGRSYVETNGANVTNPILADALTKPCVNVPFTGGPAKIKQSWTACNLVDLVFLSMTTSATPASFKIYTDTTTYGSLLSANVATAQVLYTIEFRGLYAV